MHQKIYSRFLQLLLMAVFCSTSMVMAQNNLQNLISKQLINKVKIFGDKFPEYTTDGKWQFREKPNWLSGFLAGELWYTYEMTNDKELKDLAVKQSENLIKYDELDNTHDMGFIFLPSCVKAYKITGDVKFKNAAIKAAYMLAKRFNKNGNFIRAWGKLGTDDREGLLIIDTMMNLELLYWAAQETGDIDLYNIAYKHAITAMTEVVRKNFSSYHVIEFDPATGKVLNKRTHQGVNDESTWARGQAWGIYGFAISYKYTGDKRFLNISKKMADYFIAHLPEDQIPFWDLDLSGKDVVRDASAVAIAASGMFLLSDLVSSKNSFEKYFNEAEKITNSLKENYIFTKSKRPVEEGVLLHTVYNFAKGWGIDESFPCGDYYFIEAVKKQFDSYSYQSIIQDNQTRQIYNINKNWFYLEDNSEEINDLFRTSKSWEKIDLPHSWNKFDALDAEPGYRRDASWYEKKLFVPKLSYNQKIILHFNAANISSKIFVNDQFVKQHIGGYIGFDVDITSFIKQGEFNSIKVRVDNSINPNIIPSQKSDFYIYGGLTRNVFLKVMPENYIEQIKISTPKVNEKTAQTSIDVKIISSENFKAKLNLLLNDPSGKTVKEKEFSQNIISGINEFTINLPELNNPVLWSTDSPNLYTVNVQLLKNRKLIDSTSDKIGYRWFEFKEHGAFYLNGKKLLIRGTHRHEDYAGMANALPDSLNWKDMKMIKEMGANFVRLAHYPQDPIVYKACDELGLLVWSELPWCRGGMGGEVWKSNTKRLLKEMIDEDYNHPSVIIWSLGNELDWLPDFPGGDNRDSLRTFFKELNNISHKLDPYRLTAARKFYDGSDIVDVFSPSIWSGWYSGVYKNYQKAIEDAQKKYPHFFHVEYGGDSHVGRHTETPINGDGILNPNEWDEKPVQAKIQNIASMGDWSESYIVDLFDWHLRYTELSTTFAGNVQWAFKDFPTPLRPENPIPYMNQKGLVDRDGNPKDAYYVFKSYWTKDPAFCYIESHTWTDRSGPKNTDRLVKVFSNCDEVELILNGDSQGKIKKDITKFPASGLFWNVKFKEGENVLEAVGFNNNAKVTTDEMKLNFTYMKSGNPEEIKLSCEKLPNGNLLITALAIDKNQKICLDYNKLIYFTSEGEGHLYENYGTPTRSSIIQMANGKTQIEFKPVPLGKAVIEARNQDFKGSYLTIENQ